MITQAISLRLSIPNDPSKTYSSHKDRVRSMHQQRNLSIIAFRKSSKNGTWPDNLLKKLISLQQIQPSVPGNKITKDNLCKLKILKTIKQSHDGYFKISDEDLAYQFDDEDESKPKLTPQQLRRLTKIRNLVSVHDIDFDKDCYVKRIGTPVSNMRNRELPSPLAQIAQVAQFSMPYTFGSNEDTKGAKTTRFHTKKPSTSANYLKEFQKVSDFYL